MAARAASVSAPEPEKEVAEMRTSSADFAPRPADILSFFSSAPNLANQNFSKRRGRRKQRRVLAGVLALALIQALARFAPLASANLSQTTEPPSAFFDEPQPLVHLLDSGSGLGLAASSSQRRPPNEDSSSVSPSLITAKCWNSFEGDNDCRQLNVIAASNSDQQPDDNSIITPVVIFESSSSIEPPTPGDFYQPAGDTDANQQPPAHLAPPYFSPTPRPTPAGNVVLTRHRTPPTADERFEATPTGATAFPSDLPDSSSASDLDRWRPVPSSTVGSSDEPVTRPSTSIYVATPQPSRPTTTGRTCRDENDDDCDEPTENGVGDGSDNNVDGERVSPTRKFKGDSPASTSSLVPDSGSGDGQPPTDDDNEADEDDDTDGETRDPSETIDDNRVAEGSGEIDPMQVKQQVETTSVITSSKNEVTRTDAKYVDITTTYRPQVRLESTTPRARQPGAEIEVVVHPTLPPSFPSTTTTMPSSTQWLRFNPTDGSVVGTVLTTTPATPTTTTIMQDETVTSKPIYPSTNQSRDSIESLLGGSDQLNQKAGPGEGGDEKSMLTTPTIDEAELNTFKPIPMPGGGQRFEVDRGSNSDVSGQNSSPNRQLADRHKFDPSTMKLGNPWTQTNRHQPNPAGNDLSASTQQLSGPQHPGMMPSVPLGRDGVPVKSETGQKMQSEILFTLIIWSVVFILCITTLIFVIMFISNWQRNSARRTALLQKANLMNGRNNGPDSVGGAGQLVGSMSHANHLMAGMQQPSLLTTYSLGGQGVNMGKVTTSVIKPTNADIIEEDERGSRDLQLDRSGGSKDHLLTGEESIGGGDQNILHHIPSRQQHGVTNASWSTEDQQTSSSGSQRTNDSISNHRSDLNDSAQQMNGTQRPKFPNSLSDGRHNSSSLSDSQCSPDGSNNVIALPPMSHRQAHFNNDGHYPTDNPPYSMQLSQSPVVQSTMVGPPAGMQPMMYNEGGHQQVSYDRNSLNRDFASSRSVEDLHRVGAPPMTIMRPQMIRTSPMNGSSHVQLPGGPYPPMHQQHMLQGPIPAMNEPPFKNGIGGQLQAPILDDRRVRPIEGIDTHHQFNQVISPARVAMNPLATLGRRYQPGVGLNRNIYSEDSSSFMTTSPSLARTSSSSSFAFANSANVTPMPRAKAPVDSPGTMFTNYRAPLISNVNNGAPPPILGRKDRSEAWYL